MIRNFLRCLIFLLGRSRKVKLSHMILLIKKAQALNIRLNEKALIAVFKEQRKKITFEVFKELINPEM